MEQSIISSDSHIIEVPDLWEKGMPSSLRERAPKMFFDDKRDAWMFGSPEVQIQAVGGLFMAGQQPGHSQTGWQRDPLGRTAAELAGSGRVRQPLFEGDDRR